MPGPEFTLIKAARLIDGRGGPPIPRGAVLIEGERVRTVGREAEVASPEGATVEVLDYLDHTVLPGLVDSHVHLNGFGDGRAGDELATLQDEVFAMQSARNARTHLESGVTTVRDCGAKNRTTLMSREASEILKLATPRMVLTGRPMAIVGGHLSYFGIEATGPDGCRAEVRQLIKEGADFVKMTATGGSTRTSFKWRPSFGPQELAAIVDETHKFGKHTVAHCVSSQAIEWCLDAGVDTIVHGFHADPDGTMHFRPEIAERMAEQGTILNPTLHDGRSSIWRLESKQESEGLTDAERFQLEEARRVYEHILESFAKNRNAGVPLVCGSDSSWATYPMGGYQFDIEAHVDGGMTPPEAIVAATRDAARSCWVDRDVGTLEPGKFADVLVVKGDPSVDIKALRHVTDVLLGGRRVARSG